MSETKYNFGGFYHPAFFRMNVPTPGSLLNLNKVLEEAHSFYLHEYIHFLQDISTTDGLANAAMVGNYIRYAVQALKTSGTTLPLRVPETAIIAPMQALRQVYLGDAIAAEGVSQPATWQVVHVELVNSGMTLPDGRQPLRVAVTFASGEQHFFGATWLSESMAYVAENMLYPNAKPSPLVAYKSAELIADCIYPALGGQDRENILALCDASLLFFHPGQAFVLILRKMAADNWLPASAEEVYSFADKAFLFDYEGIATTSGLLAFSGGQAINVLAGYFTADYFSANADWIREVILRANILREKDPYFLLRLVREGTIKRNQYFPFLLDWLGSPLTTNNADESSMVVMRSFPQMQDMHLDMFRAIKEVMSLFTSGKRRCGMLEYCRESCAEQQKDDITNDLCRTAPWQRSTEGELCAYGAVWRMWGLSDIEPQFAASPDTP